MVSHHQLGSLFSQGTNLVLDVEDWLRTHPLAFQVVLVDLGVFGSNVDLGYVLLAIHLQSQVRSFHDMTTISRRLSRKPRGVRCEAFLSIPFS